MGATQAQDLAENSGLTGQKNLPTIANDMITVSGPRPALSELPVS